MACAQSYSAPTVQGRPHQRRSIYQPPSGLMSWSGGVCMCARAEIFSKICKKPESTLEYVRQRRTASKYLVFALYTDCNLVVSKMFTK